MGKELKKLKTGYNKPQGGKIFDDDCVIEGCDPLKIMIQTAVICVVLVLSTYLIIGCK